MKPIKIPEFPFQAYWIVSRYSAESGSRIEVYQVRIIGYDETSGWYFKVIKTLWQMEHRIINDNMEYNSSELENFCYDLYSVKLKVEALQKEFLDRSQNSLELNNDESGRLLEELVSLDKKSSNLRRSIQTLEKTKFPDTRSLYEKL